MYIVNVNVIEYMMILENKNFDRAVSENKESKTEITTLKILSSKNVPSKVYSL